MESTEKATVGTAQTEFQSLRVFRVKWFANKKGTLFAANNTDEATRFALAWANSVLEGEEEPVVPLLPYAITSVAQEESIVFANEWRVP